MKNRHDIRKEVGGGAREVDERMKFATDFPTEVELVDVVKKFGSSSREISEQHMHGRAVVEARQGTTWSANGEPIM